MKIRLFKASDNLSTDELELQMKKLEFEIKKKKELEGQYQI
jgi:hypothetical protein